MDCSTVVKNLVSEVKNFELQLICVAFCKLLKFSKSMILKLGFLSIHRVFPRAQHGWFKKVNFQNLRHVLPSHVLPVKVPHRISFLTSSITIIPSSGWQSKGKFSSNSHPLLHWVFVAVRGLSLVATSRGYSSLWCAGFSLRWLLLLQSMGSRCKAFSSCGSRALERRLSSCGTRA